MVQAHGLNKEESLVQRIRLLISNKNKLNQFNAIWLRSRGVFFLLSDPGGHGGAASFASHPPTSFSSSYLNTIRRTETDEGAFGTPY